MMSGAEISQIIMAAGTLVTAVGGVILAIRKLDKIEKATDGIVTQLVNSTKSEATMVGHAEGKAAGKESEKAAQAGRDEAKAEGKAEAQADQSLVPSSAAVIRIEGKLQLTPPDAIEKPDA